MSAIQGLRRGKAIQGTAGGKTSPNPTKGAASVVHFYSGDKGFTLLFQNVGVKLSNFVEGYSRSIVLIERSLSATIFSASAIKKADKILDPTAQNFIDAIKELVEGGYYVDVYTHGHGSDEQFAVSKGFSESGFILASEIAARLDPKSMHLTKLPIRLVGMWNCFASTLNDTWTNLGAKCSFGARGVEYYPQQCNKFKTNWDAGKSVQAAINYANTGSSRTASQTLMLVQAKASKKKWGGCPFGKTILGKDDCAKAYFKYAYGVSGKEWPVGYGGKQYMNYSSTLLCSGSKNLTKKAKLSW